jgi:hypothetical protein
MTVKHFFVQFLGFIGKSIDDNSHERQEKNQIHHFLQQQVSEFSFKSCIKDLTADQIKVPAHLTPIVKLQKANRHRHDFEALNYRSNSQLHFIVICKW